MEIVGMITLWFAECFRVFLVPFYGNMSFFKLFVFVAIALILIWFLRSMFNMGINEGIGESVFGRGKKGN